MEPSPVPFIIKNRLIKTLKKVKLNAKDQNLKEGVVNDR